VPPGVKIDLPLQAYFRLNSANIGQFERTLIIADEGAQIHYVEGCTAPIYTTDSFHSGVIEIVVKKGARVRYTTIQNWSVNVYNLVTQRAFVYEGGTMEWVDANLGSKADHEVPFLLPCLALERTARSCRWPSRALDSTRMPAARLSTSPTYQQQGLFQVDQQGHGAHFIPRPAQSA